LYRAQAYLIDEQPLTIGTAIPENSRGFNLSGSLNGISRSHCSVYTESNQVWVDDHSTYGTFLNGQIIDGHTVVKLGDELRVGTPGEELQFIALADPQQAHGA
jgi:pSer/pThr/pTyr-binding forkhead associated (FHA) protein